MRALSPFLGFLLLLAGLGISMPASALGEAAPDFSLRDINGKQVSLSDHAGKVVLINFWATWCQPCQVEMPHLQAMQTDFAEKGFLVLAISTDEARSSSQVKPLVKRNGFTFPVLLDTQTAVVAKYNPAKVLPYSVILDKEHKIQFVHHGYSPGDEVGMRSEIEGLLAQ